MDFASSRLRLRLRRHRLFCSPSIVKFKSLNGEFRFQLTAEKYLFINIISNMIMYGTRHSFCAVWVPWERSLFRKRKRKRRYILRMTNRHAISGYWSYYIHFPICKATRNSYGFKCSIIDDVGASKAFMKARINLCKFWSKSRWSGTFYWIKLWTYVYKFWTWEICYLAIRRIRNYHHIWLPEFVIRVIFDLSKRESFEQLKDFSHEWVSL